MYIVVARSVVWLDTSNTQKTNIYICVENIVLFIWRPRISRNERCWEFCGMGAKFLGMDSKNRGRNLFQTEFFFVSYHHKRTRIFHSILQNNNLLMFAWRLGGLILNDDMLGIWKNVCGTRSRLDDVWIMHVYGSWVKRSLEHKRTFILMNIRQIYGKCKHFVWKYVAAWGHCLLLK